MIDMQKALMMLRVQLYSAAQLTKGTDRIEFWTLLDEIEKIRPPDMQNARYRGG